MLCTEQGCTNEAQYTYIWPWGQEGACCGPHRLTLDQRSTQQLKRGRLNFSTIDPGKPQPVSRDERAALRARIIVLEEDIAERHRDVLAAKQANDDLAQENVRLRNLAGRLESEARDAKAECAQACIERDQAKTDAGQAVAEKKRLEALVWSLSATQAAANSVSGGSSQAP